MFLLALFLSFLFDVTSVLRMNNTGKIMCTVCGVKKLEEPFQEAIKFHGVGQNKVEVRYFFKYFCFV